MSDLYLNPGESLILTTSRIHVNFIPFDLMLTSLRLILLDSVHERFSPQVIPIGDIFSVNGGTISTGEPIIKITIAGDHGDGSLIPIDFVFSQAPNQTRRQERDGWLRALMEKLVEVRQEKVLSGIQPAGEDARDRPTIRRWIAPEILYPMPLVSVPDLPAAGNGNISSPAESPVAGENSAGGPERVPPPSPEFEGPPVPAGLDNESAGESSGSDRKKAETIPAGEPGPAGESWSTREKVAGSVDLPGSLIHELTPHPADIPGPQETSSGKEKEPAPPVAETSGSGMPDESPRVPEGEPDAVPGGSATGIPDARMPEKPQSHEENHHEQADPKNPLTPPVVNWPVIREVPVPGTSGPGMQDSMYPSPATVNPPEEPENLPRAHSASPPPAPGPVDPETSYPAPAPENNPAIPGGEPVSGEPVGGSPAPGPLPQLPVGVTGRGKFPRGQTVIISIGVVIGIILVIAVLGLFFLHTPPTETYLPVPPVAPVITVNETPTIRPVAIPGTGVWVRVVYSRYYYGQIGNPAGLQEVGGTGDQFYFIRNSGNLVQADIQKRDNSGDTLTVSVYNNGTRVFNTSLRSPMGTISVLIDPATGNPPVPHS